MMEKITGKDLIEAGYRPGKWFTDAVKAANRLIESGRTRKQAIAEISTMASKPHLPLKPAHTTPIHMKIHATNPDETQNVQQVFDTMVELVRTPVVKFAAVMPDACPAGPLGTIPVGGVVASEAIHPGMHSADICCSMMISVFDNVAPKELLDAVHSTTHFGPGGRKSEDQMYIHKSLVAEIAHNPFLAEAEKLSATHFATQGDGNHFAFVGTLKSTGQTALVTHHGSRGPGAALYKTGMRIAEKYRKELSPETLPQNAWIPAGTQDCKNYWNALQTMRTWTRESHRAIHRLALNNTKSACLVCQFWNEHNFVFKRDDGLFYHAKGATPAFDNWAHDASQHTLIPLNMSEPILIVRGKNEPTSLGFAPHGAGRNMSRTKHKAKMTGKTDEEIFNEETAGLDVRFFSGITDISELPSAYKSAAEVRAQIEYYGLCEIVDEVLPYGCIMAGDWERDAPWRKKKEVKKS